MPENILKGIIKIEAPGAKEQFAQVEQGAANLKKSGDKLIFSLDQLQQKLKAKRNLLISETDLGRIKAYQSEVANLEKEVGRVGKITLGGTAAGLDSIGSAATKGYSVLRNLAYIIPGIGIGGLVAGFSDFFIEMVSGGNVLENVARKLGAFKNVAVDSKLVFSSFKDIFKDATKGAAEDSVKLEIFKQKLTDVTIPASERNKILKQYNSIADDTNKIDATQINNLDLINQKIDAQNTLILQRALSVAAMSKVTEAANKLIENEVKLQEQLSREGFKDLADYDKKQKEAADNRQKLFKKDPKAFEQDQDNLNKVRAGLDGVINPALKAAKSFDVSREGLNSLVASVKTGRAELQKLVGNLSGLITIPGLTTEKTQDKNNKEKFSFLFDFLPFDPNGKLKPEQKSQLLDAASKFQKEFSGIFKGVNDLLIGSDQQRIEKSIQFDLNLKAGRVKFDLTKIKEATDKAIKTSDVIPESTIGEIDATIVDKFIKGVQNAQETLKNKNLFGDLSFISTDLKLAIDLFKTRVEQIGGDIPKILEGVDIHGKAVELKFDDLFDTTKISNTDALDALKKAFDKIKGNVKAQTVDLKNSIQDAFNSAFIGISTEGLSSIGDVIGAALTGNDIGSVFQAFEQTLGSAVQSLGKQIIALNVAALAAKKSLSLTFANPAVGIAAGIALVAVGAALKNLVSGGLKGFNKGGIVPGYGNGDTVPAMLTPGEFVVTKDKAPLAKALFGGTPSIKGFQLGGDVSFIPKITIPSLPSTNFAKLNNPVYRNMGKQNVDVQVEVIGKIAGSDIVLSHSRTLKQQKITV